MPLILLIEDDPTQRLITARALTKAGHQVVEAADGVDGLQMARSHKPDLIVCDVVMPRMNGYQIVTALRQEAGLSAIPVIMLTAMTERAHMRIAMTSGADDYIAKPFAFEELTEAVETLLAKRRAQVEAFVQSVKSEIVQALDDQRQELAGQYERRFVQELNSRWERGEKANAELQFEHATVLMCDLFGAGLAHLGGSAETAQLIRRAYQAARDALYLFGAKHLLAYGNDMLAVFVEPPEAVGVSPSVRAVRAAFALGKAISALAPAAPAESAARLTPTVALHEGPLTLVHVSDPLHGDADATLATGVTVESVKMLRDFAQSSQWAVAASASMVRGLDVKVTSGRQATMEAAAVAAPIEAVELLGVA